MALCDVWLCSSYGLDALCECSSSICFLLLWSTNCRLLSKEVLISRASLIRCLLYAICSIGEWRCHLELGFGQPDNDLSQESLCASITLWTWKFGCHWFLNAVTGHLLLLLTILCCCTFHIIFDVMLLHMLLFIRDVDFSLMLLLSLVDSVSSGRYQLFFLFYHFYCLDNVLQELL